VNPRDQAVAGCDHEAPQQGAPDAAVLEGPLDRDGEFRRSWRAGPDQPELTDPAYFTRDDIAQHEAAAPVQPSQ
jgi:hypothetical protein